jgi:isopenicillin N synthase-like dioxygenase
MQTERATHITSQPHKHPVDKDSPSLLRAMSTLSQKVVTISYNDLVRITLENSVKQDLLIKIGQAFGNDDECLGILAVTDVPRLEPMRHKLLTLARDLALLPMEELGAVTDEASGYQVGWSHGKEKVEGDKLDLAKGSFYANPLTDNLLESRPNTDPKLARDNPAFFAPNIWPTSSLPDFENSFKELGTLVCDVGRLLARLCDAYVKSKVSGIPCYHEGCHIACGKEGLS